MSPNHQAWILSRSGRRINVFDVRSEDILIDDMASGLAKHNRFNGNTSRPIDVAYHSIWVSRVAAMFCANDARRQSAAIQGLLHDGSDYIMGDVTKWLKHSPAMAEFRRVEDECQATIYRAFGCPTDMMPEVKAADSLMVRVEAEDTWGPNWSFVDGYGPLNPTQRALVEGWDPPSDWRMSYTLFLAEYAKLAVPVSV